MVVSANSELENWDHLGTFLEMAQYWGESDDGAAAPCAGGGGGMVAATRPPACWAALGDSCPARALEAAHKLA